MKQGISSLGIVHRVLSLLLIWSFPACDHRSVPATDAMIEAFSQDVEISDRALSNHCFAQALDLGQGSNFEEQITLMDVPWTARLVAEAKSCLANSHLSLTTEPRSTQISAALYQCDGTLLREGWEVCVSDSCWEQLEYGWNGCLAQEFVIVLKNKGDSAINLKIIVKAIDPGD